MSVAFFDMDRTLLTVTSGSLWMRYLRRRGEIGRLQLLRAMGWAIQYRLSILDMAGLSQKLVVGMRGDSEEEMIAKCKLWFEAEVRHTIAARAREAVERHRAQKHHLVLLTGATQYIAEPVAQAVGVGDVICSRLEVEKGRFTGRLIEPLCVGAGKVACAEEWAERKGVNLAAATFYTDSYTDLPMLERVGHPVAVNPDPRLARTARRRGWPIELWAP